MHAYHRVPAGPARRTSTWATSLRRALRARGVPTRGLPARATLLAALTASTFAALPAPARAQETKLVVMIVIDQLRGDIVDRYSTAFDGGFRRLLDEGMHFTQASHAHARTSTAPGHATLATGVFPDRHGVIANSWQQKKGVRWESMYAVENLDSPILGFENEPLLPGRSPKNLIRDGLPDWFAAFDQDSRRVSISRKDRAAIPMGGQRTQQVYWILPELARFITSTHYMGRYPGWIERFNQRVMPDIYAPRVWESMVPPELAHLARADAAPYEFDGVHTTFPHVSADENPDTTLQQHNVWASELPFADDAVMALAGTAIDELDLGQRDEIDFLAISLSATDRVGHQFGPLSQEVFSTVINVDRLLGDFFTLLDEEVGEGRWVVGLSADHGVLTMPEYARELGNPNADRVMMRDAYQALGADVTEAAQSGGSPDQIAARIAEASERETFVDRAYTQHDITRGEPADSFAILYRNSYYPGRAWGELSRFGVELRYREDDLLAAAPTGTNHETVYWHDRWVPMMFLGAGVPHGSSDEPVYTVDFAPTLAALAGIPVPDDLDGRRIF